MMQLVTPVLISMDAKQKHTFREIMLTEEEVTVHFVTRSYRMVLSLYYVKLLI